MSHSGLVAGTPYYMAPEQANGETTDHRADLFSLGSTLYAICAGHPPFRAETPLAVLRRVCDEPPRPLREINPEIPSWLESLIARLMAKDRSQRYQTADEAFDVLKKCLAHVQQPLSSPLPPGLGAGPRKRPIKQAWKPVAMLSSIACVGAAIVLSASRSKPGPDPRSKATAPNAAARPPSESRPEGTAGDTIQQLIDQSRERAQQMEKDVMHRETDSAADPISARSSSLQSAAQRRARHPFERLGPEVIKNCSFDPLSPMNRR